MTPPGARRADRDDLIKNHGKPAHSADSCRAFWRLFLEADLVHFVSDFVTDAAAKNPLHTVTVFVQEKLVVARPANGGSGKVSWMIVSIVLSRSSQLLVTTDGITFIPPVP